VWHRLQGQGYLSELQGGYEVSGDGLKELENNNISENLEIRYEYTKAPGVSGSEVIPQPGFLQTDGWLQPTLHKSRD
jgi:hypothetical protein